MKLATLLNDQAGRPAPEWDTAFADVEIAGLTADSREVSSGDLFAALPGAQVDGRRFIPNALSAGAKAILSTPDVDPAATDAARIALITDPEPRQRLAWIADRFFEVQPATQVAVTGTNGKTSVASFIQQIWTAAGRKAASMGTLGIRGPGVDRYGALTTPDPVSLHRDLADLTAAGIDHLAIEASSHGLDQFRLDGLRLSAAGFTNLSRDHIDYHGTMAAYLESKLRLFTDLLPAGSTVVINADSDVYAAVRSCAAEAELTVVSYGKSADPGDIVLTGLAPTAEGQRMDLTVFGDAVSVDLPLAGDFQAWNALCALGLVLTSGVALDVAVEALENLQGAPGRIELVGTRENGAAVYVDYAHTPDALETVLKALRPHVDRQLSVVFGCGGDRDAGKRPMMGAAAQAHADTAFVTDDNPRSETPAAIRAAIMPACPDATEIGDRREAIHTAVAALQAGDVLVIAGKGHEQGQIVGETTLPFDDATVAREALSAAEAAA